MESPFKHIIFNTKPCSNLVLAVPSGLLHYRPGCWLPLDIRRWKNYCQSPSEGFPETSCHQTREIKPGISLVFTSLLRRRSYDSSRNVSRIAWRGKRTLAFKRLSWLRSLQIWHVYREIKREKNGNTWLIKGGTPSYLHVLSVYSPLRLPATLYVCQQPSATDYNHMRPSTFLWLSITLWDRL